MSRIGWLLLLVLGLQPSQAHGLRLQRYDQELNLEVADLLMPSNQHVGELRTYLGYVLFDNHEIGLVAMVTPIYPEWSKYVFDARSWGLFYRITIPTENQRFSPFIGFDANRIETDKHSVYRRYDGEYGSEIGVRVILRETNIARYGFTLAARWQTIMTKQQGLVRVSGAGLSFTMLSP